jgi:hypothetical protein
MLPVVPEYEDTDPIWKDTIKQVIAKNAKVCPSYIAVEKVKPLWICSDSLDRSLHLEEKPITELRSAYEIKMI